METKKLKFLLKLLGFPDYRAPVSSSSPVKPTSKTRLSELERICRELRDRDLVGCTEEITKIKIAPPGKSLLQLDPTGLPITPQELKILKACEKGTITPSQIKLTPAKTRDSLIDSLATRGFIEAAQTKITDVWLTELGKEYLREEYSPSGYQPIVSLDMLNNYLCFMRKFMSRELQASTVQNVGASTLTTSPAPVTRQLTSPPSDEEIVQIIRNLDRKMGTNNYLPIFHLREELQPPFSKEELDQALYRLEQQDKIELSSLQEVRGYTSEQINTGIIQDIGGPLFFIIVT
jgi:hypothetical protein